MPGSMVEKLLALTSLPRPVAELYYYDGPMHYFGVHEDQVVLCALAESTDRNESWFVGPIPRMETMKVMTGQVTLAEFIKRHCSFRADKAPEGFRVRAARPEDFDTACLPEEGFRLDLKHEVACTANERLRVALGDHQPGRVLYVSVQERCAPIHGLGVFLTNLVDYAADTYDQLKNGLLPAARRMVQRIDLSLARAEVAPETSMSFRLFMPMAEAEQTAGNPPPLEFSDALASALTTLSGPIPREEDVRERFSKQVIGSMKRLIRGAEELNSEVQIVALQRTANSARFIAPSKLTVAHAAHWREILDTFQDVEQTGTQTRRFVIRGSFRTISDKPGARFSFEPDWEAQENAHVPQEVRKKVLSGKLRDHTLAGQFRTVGLSRPVQATFEMKMFADGQKNWELHRVTSIAAQGER